MALQGLKGGYRCAQIALKRNIMTSSWNSVKAQEDFQKNPYFEKYANKIKELQRTDNEEFLARLKTVEERKSVNKPAGTQVQARAPAAYPGPGPRKAGDFKRRQLGDIMNVELLAGKSPEEISAIWKEYYCNKDDVIYGSLTKEEFNSFILNCRQYPAFLVPLPRNDGFEFFMVLFHNDEFHLTPLALYHKYKEDSPESLCISYFAELAQDIVLVLGEYDNKVLSPIEAQCLVNSLQLFYHSKNRLEVVKTFNQSPENFDYNILLREINSLSLEKQ